MSILNKIAGVLGYEEKKSVSVDDPTPRPSDVVSDEDNYPESAKQHDYWGTKVQKTLYIDSSDKLRYEEFDKMDNEMPEISSALDINADFIIYPNSYDKTKVFKVKSTDKKAQNIIDEVDARISMQEQLYAQVRAMLKYGDNVEELVVDVSGKQFLGFRNIPVRTIVPVMNDGFPSSSPYMLQHIEGKTIASLDNDEVFHLSLNTDRKRYSAHGKGVSMIEKSRLSYRQILLMEEGMMISRLSRANQNYAMIVDVGELQGVEALNFLDKYKSRVMRRKYIDNQTGRWKWKYNPLSVIEDIMVPTRAGSGGNVIPLNNNSAVGKNIEDVMYYQDKFIYSTGTPKLLIGKELDINAKSTSDVQMSTFLRRIRRFQTIISPPIKLLYKHILKIEGMNVDLASLNIEWASNSTIDQERIYIIEKLKAEVAKILKVDLKVVDDIYIYTTLMGMSEDEAKAMKLRMDDVREDEADKALDMANSLNTINPNDKDEEKPPTKEESIAIIKEKLTESEFAEWEKMNEIVENNPVIGKMMFELIELSQAKIGE